MGSKISKSAKKPSKLKGKKSQSVGASVTAPRRTEIRMEVIIERKRVRELAESRTNAYRGKASHGIVSQLRALDPSREINFLDYAFSVEMTGKRLKVWKLILEYVEDMECIGNLRETCVMFKDLLREKYVAGMLPQILWKNFGVLGIGRRDWIKMLRALRLVSRTTKRTVNTLITRGSSCPTRNDKGSSAHVHTPDCPFIQEQVPILHVGAKEVGKGRLRESEECIFRGKNHAAYLSIPLRALVLDEIREDGVGIGSEDGYCAFYRMISCIGRKFLSFHFITTKSSSETYRRVAWFVEKLPNLENLVIDLSGTTPQEPRERSIEAFPKCRHLKRYAEGPKGFDAPYLMEILSANPTVEELVLGETSYMGWRNIKRMIDTLQITTFHTSSIPKDPLFFKATLDWTLHLKSLVLWEENDEMGEWEIPGENLFNFLSRMESLVDLKVSMPCLREADEECTEVKLPKLERLTWKLFPTFCNLAFLESAENLQHLALVLSNEFKGTGNVMEFLGGWNIPVLFPALKRIQIKSQDGERFKTVWKMG